MSAVCETLGVARSNIAATQAPVLVSMAVIATGRPRRRGSRCCSIEAKKLFMSM